MSTEILNDQLPRLPLWRPTLTLFVLLTVILGIAYPLAVTGVGQLLFPHQANGSLIERNGQAVGSELIGQPFTNPRYFWSRPSATASTPYNAANSGGANLGPSNPELLKQIGERSQQLRAANPAQSGPVPMDLVTTSASGLDPHISPQAAHYQAARVASAHGLTPEQVRVLIDAHTEGPQLGLFGQARVNVLKLNLALDALKR